jgi:hypothetical protein
MLPPALAESLVPELVVKTYSELTCVTCATATGPMLSIGGLAAVSSPVLSTPYCHSVPASVFPPAVLLST